MPFNIYKVNIMNVNDELAELSILWNDLAMLIDAEECYNERYYNSEYKRIISRLNEIGGAK